MIEIIKNAVTRSAWLFLASAWLYTLSFIFTNYLSYSSSAEKVANILSEYIQGEENSFQNILHDTSEINAIVSNTPSRIKEQLVTDAQGIFAYRLTDFETPDEIFWNTNKMLVERQDLYKEDGNYLVTYQNGIFEFIKRTVTVNKASYLFCSLIPVHWQYFLENEYLQPGFAVHEEIGNAYEIKPAGIGAAVKNSAHKTLFSIREKTATNTDKPGSFSIILRIISLMFLLVFINNIASEIVRKINFLSGFLFLAVMFFIIRLIVYFLPFPFDYNSLKLFSSKIYYGDFINNSLGNFFLNAVILLWLIVFFRRFYRVLETGIIKYKPLENTLKYLLFLIIPLYTFYNATLISSLVTQSTISFNASDFFSLSIYSLIGFSIICIILYTWLYTTSLLFQVCSTLHIPLFWRYVLLLSSCFLIISLNIFHLQNQILLCVSGYLLFVYLFILYRSNPSGKSLVSSSFFIVWALILTAATSALIVYQNDVAEKANRIKLAATMQQDTDSSGIYLLKISLAGFSDHHLDNSVLRLNNAEANINIRDSLRSAFISAYNNKYLTRIYFFNNRNQPVFNADSTSYDVINSVVENKGLSTSINNLYYYKTNNDTYNYIYRRSLSDSNGNIGSVFVLIQPRSLQNDALIPELFRQMDDVTLQFDRGYIYGVYDKRRLVSEFTGFNFADSITHAQVPATKFIYRDSLGYNQLWYNASKDKLIIIAKKNNVFFNYITLFAYLFIIFIVLAFLVHESRKVLEEPVQIFTLKNLFRFNITTQIQATIIGISILSFSIICIATISFFIYRFNKNTNMQLVITSQVIANEIKQVLNFYETPLADYNEEETDESEFERKVLDMSAIHNTDINFYNRSGKLIVSSQPYIYSKQILSNKMNPMAYFEMHYMHSTRFIHTETVGNFDYQSIYLPLKDDNDETVAYLNIPSLSSHKELQEEISDFLIAVIILNALIFIFAGAISVTLTGRITSSLELIGNKMKQINIGITNEEIEWKSKDEIGVLVEEYNKMVKKLEQSAAALVRSERQGAWQQMARQVAHEIKNPLTPMKLSIQYLQRTMQNNSAEAVELSKKLASSLIEQIDQLSKIAGDFSQFANIEHTQPEAFDVIEAVENLVNIYNADSQIEINFLHQAKPVIIFCDKIQVNRLFTNLIKNAIEASGNRKTVLLQINQFTRNDNVIISVRDNGLGIENDQQSKIFNPNFTTKSSGTGLGLAICKAIVEKANGKIWFITSPGSGTVFFVELPLHLQIISNELTQA